MKLQASDPSCTIITKVDVMTKESATSNGIYFLILTIVFGLIAFLIPNTNYETEYYASIIDKYTNQIEIRKIYKGIDSLSGFIHIEIVPYFSNPSKVRNSRIVIDGRLFLMSENGNVIGERNISRSINYRVNKDYNRIIITEFDNIDFSACIAFFDIKTDLRDLMSVKLTMVGLNRSICLASLYCISAMAIIDGMILILIISKRYKPYSIDQWAAVILSGSLFLIDGPWIVLQYFSVPGFAVSFSVLIQIFKILFYVYIFIFFSVRTKNAIFDIFNNYILYLIYVAIALIIIVFEFVMTAGKSMVMIPVIDKNTALFVVLVVLFIGYNLSIAGLIIYGISKTENVDIWAITYHSGLFIVFIFLNIATFLTKILVPMLQAGFSAASDLFFILEANMIVFSIVIMNTPYDKYENNPYSSRLQNTNVV